MSTQSVFLSVLQSAYNRWLFTASLLSSVAGVIHAYYMPEHFEMWVGYGMFFLVVTVCQVLLPLVLLGFRPVSHIVLWAGILCNAAIIIMWLISRTIGLPYGPMTGEIESIGVLDLSSKFAEFGVIICMIALMRMQADFVSNNS